MKKSLPFLFSLFFISNSQAAVVYTDVDPDEHFTSTSDFMINSNDGVRFELDFNFPTLRTDQIPGSTMRFATPNSSSFGVLMYSANDMVDGSGVYFSQLSDMMTPGDEYYIGFSIEMSGNTHYGWMKVTSTTGTGAASVTVHEYAYEDVANTGIAAGDKGVFASIEENDSIDSFTTFPNPTEGSLTVEFNQEQTQLSIELLSLSGQLLQYMTIENSSVACLNIESPSGVYLLRIKDQNGGVATQRLLKK